MCGGVQVCAGVCIACDDVSRDPYSTLYVDREAGTAGTHSTGDDLVLVVEA